MRGVRKVVAGAALFGLVFTLAGCAQTVSLQPGPDANNPDCAAVMVRLKDTIVVNNPDGTVDLDRRNTNAQSTAAWGDPTAVIMGCGVPVPGPTTEDCRSIQAVDWIIVPEEADGQRNIRATTFGREPAVDVFIDLSVVNDPLIVLDDISRTVQTAIPTTTRTCTDRPSS